MAVLLMSVLGRSGRRKKSGLRPWLAAEPRVVATRSCRCCSGGAVEFIVDPRGTVPAGADAEHGLCESSPAVLEESA